MNVYGLVEFHKRLDHANLKIKDSIDSGLIGDLLYVHVEYSQRRSIPSEIFSKWVEGTNIFQYLGVHYVDIIYFVTGYLPKRLVATGQKKPSKGKTNKYILGTNKKQNVHIQVYNMDNKRYELNMYIN